MKNVKCFQPPCLLAALLTVISPTYAQNAVPMLINYQGELRRLATAQPVPDGSYSMVFRILDAETAGTELWRGVHSDLNANPVMIANGDFSVILGSGTGNALSPSVFGKRPDVWLEITIEGETLKPRQRITSTAYSMVSENSRLLGGKQPSDFVIQAHGFRLETNATSPNIIAGHGDNAVAAGSVGATISGGGLDENANSVTDSYGTVGGGANNQAGNNVITATDAGYATVGGGYSNTASGYFGTVGGGASNDASGTEATVGGGWSNDASGSAATVGGGELNTAGNGCATVAGGRNNTANGVEATVGGGSDNIAGALFATVGGGYDNTADARAATLGGGYSNTASGMYATVGGGRLNRCDASYGTIAGGGPQDLNNASATRNLVTDEYGTVGGGGGNQAGDDAGTELDAGYATVAGGANNTASGLGAAVCGGYGNTASGRWAAVAGGMSNDASGDLATVAGGFDNTAQGFYSFAAGYRAKANHRGSFVLADSTNEDFASVREDALRVRFNGGATFVVNDDYWVRFWGTGTHLIDASNGAHLTTGGVWTNGSDRDTKENFAPVEGKEVLRQLARLAICTWNFKGENPSVRHMGPMAQDLYVAFGLGGDDKSIGTVDADGVALAAIQGLHRIVQEKESRISILEQRNTDLEDRLKALESLVEKLSDR
jgi:hypothetical protein